LLLSYFTVFDLRYASSIVRIKHKELTIIINVFAFLTSSKANALFTVCYVAKRAFSINGVPEIAFLTIFTHPVDSIWIIY